MSAHAPSRTDSSDAAATPTPRRRGLVTLALAGVLVAAGGGTAFAVTNSSGTPAAAGSSGAPAAAATPPAPPAAGATPPAPPVGKATPPTPKPHIDGTVTSISGDRLTVTDPEGFSRQILLSDSTTYRSGPAPSGSSSTTGTFTRSSIVVGAAVHAEGSVDPDRTTLDATVVEPRPEPSTAAGPVAPPAAPATTPSSAGASRSPVNGS